MRSDFVYCGGTPHDEKCASIGITDNASSLSKLEAEAYVVALRKKYGDEPDGARLRPHAEQHDFGRYYEVSCSFQNAKGHDYALRCEAGLATWDEVGMWPPVKYDDKHQPIYVIRDPWLWEKANNPRCLVYREDSPAGGGKEA